jgi:hypothetical protein
MRRWIPCVLGVAFRSMPFPMMRAPVGRLDRWGLQTRRSVQQKLKPDRAHAPSPFLPKEQKCRFNGRLQETLPIRSAGNTNLRASQPSKAA